MGISSGFRLSRSEHHSLVACPLRVVHLVLREFRFASDLERLVDAHGNVGRLPVERNDDAARVAIESRIWRGRIRFP